MGSMILYHGEPNGPSLSALAALFESGVTAETRHIDLPGGERHRIAGISEPLARDMSVEGEGPVLVIDGEAMTESVFIAQFLDETGSGHLQPKDAYAHWQMLMWCRRITERCAPAAAFLGCQAYRDLAQVPEGIASDDLRARWAQIVDGDFPEAALEDSRTKIADAAKLVEEQLADGREWLMGDISIADFETYAWLAGMVEIVPAAFEEKPGLSDWLQRVASRPSVAQALALATVPDPRKAWAPGQEINRWG
jgi:GST-like protein